MEKNDSIIHICIYETSIVVDKNNCTIHGTFLRFYARVLQPCSRYCTYFVLHTSVFIEFKALCMQTSNWSSKVNTIAFIASQNNNKNLVLLYKRSRCSYCK